MRQVFRIFTIILIAGGLNGCGEENKQKQDHVTISMVTFPGYAPLYLAKEKGLFPNVTVDLVRIESIADQRAALASGDVDMYLATYDIYQTISGMPPPGKMFLAIDSSVGADGVVVGPEVEKLTDLKGKKVGAEPGLPPYFVLQYVLYQGGMSLGDVEFEDIPSQDAGAAFIGGHLDAAGTYEPFLSNAIANREGARILLSSADTPNLITDFIVARDDLVDAQGEVLEAIAVGWFRALDFIRDNPDESFEIMGAAFGVSKEEMIDIASGIVWLGLEDNERLFSTEAQNNAYEMFGVVNDVLRKSDPTIHSAKAEDHISADTVRSLSANQ